MHGPDHRDTLDCAARLVERLLQQVGARAASPFHLHSYSSAGLALPGLALQDKRREAERLLRKIVVSNKRVLGHQHHTTLDTMGHHADVLILLVGGPGASAHRLWLTCLRRLQCAHMCVQGRHAEAESIYQQLVELGRTVLGPQHENTITWMNDLTACLLELVRQLPACCKL